MAAIALDMGTSVIKAVAFNDLGAEVAAFREVTEVLRPAPGYAEQDMSSVWSGAARAIRTVAQELHENVRFIALTGQGDGCWLVDSVGRPTGHAILWSDGRAASVVEGWRQAGVLEQAFRMNGSLTSAGLLNAILTWLYWNDPGCLERAHRALSCTGWVFYNLTGEMAVDESDASAPFFNIRARSYSPELMQLYELAWAERLLPEVRRDNERVGELSRWVADQLGLTAGLPVVLAPYDIASAAIGVGAVSSGQACSILGTTLCTEVVTDTADTHGNPSGLTIAFAAPGLYLRAFPTLAGGEVITWVQRLLDLAGPVELAELAGAVEAGAGELWFMPYLSPAGERAPFLDPTARGSFIGLSLDQGRGHVARAVLEGLTFVIRDCFEAFKVSPKELRICGGGAGSELWCQLIADMTGVPALRSNDEEVGAKGAFLTGLVATGAEADFVTAVNSYVKMGRVWEPRAAKSARYAEMYGHFLELRHLSAMAWQRLADFRPEITSPVTGRSDA